MRKAALARIAGTMMLVGVSGFQSWLIAKKNAKYMIRFLPHCRGRSERNKNLSSERVAVSCLPLACSMIMDSISCLLRDRLGGLA